MRPQQTEISRQNHSNKHPTMGKTAQNIHVDNTCDTEGRPTRDRTVTEVWIPAKASLLHRWWRCMASDQQGWYLYIQAAFVLYDTARFDCLLFLSPHVPTQRACTICQRMHAARLADCQHNAAPSSLCWHVGNNTEALLKATAFTHWQTVTDPVHLLLKWLFPKLHLHSLSLSLFSSTTRSARTQRS